MFLGITISAIDSHQRYPHFQRETTMQTIEFQLAREFIALNDLLKITGVADSGGAGKMMVAAGDVKVDNQQELRKTCKIRVGQVVTVGSDIKINVTN